MDLVISDLIDRYEGGKLSRRDLVAGLSALAAVGGGAASAFAQPAAPPPLVATGIDHASVLASDLKRSTDFYTRVFGLRVIGEDTANKIVRLGKQPAPGAPPPARPGVGPVLVSLRQQQPYGTVDHWCLKVENFNAQAMTPTLQAHGLTPAQNTEYGFYVRDPDGVVVQMF